MSLGIRSDDTLQSWLSTCAHDLPARALAAIAGGGLLLFAVSWAGPGPASWPLTAAGACGAAFGVWALAKQQIETMPLVSADRGVRGKRLALRLMRRAAAVIGVMAGAGLLMSIPVALLGRWIS